MFDKIRNPANDKWVNINDPVGKKILRHYLIQLGGAALGIVASNATCEDEMSELLGIISLLGNKLHRPLKTGVAAVELLKLENARNSLQEKLANITSASAQANHSSSPFESRMCVNSCFFCDRWKHMSPAKQSDMEREVTEATFRADQIILQLKILKESDDKVTKLMENLI